MYCLSVRGVPGCKAAGVGLTRAGKARAGLFAEACQAAATARTRNKQTGPGDKRNSERPVDLILKANCNVPASIQDSSIRGAWDEGFRSALP
jgi:hypothetical protein